MYYLHCHFMYDIRNMSNFYKYKLEITTCILKTGKNDKICTIQVRQKVSS